MAVIVMMYPRPGWSGDLGGWWVWNARASADAKPSEPAAGPPVFDPSGAAAKNLYSRVVAFATAVVGPPTTAVARNRGPRWHG